MAVLRSLCGSDAPATLMVHGANFVPAPSLACAFDGAHIRKVVAATFLSSEQLACATPEWRPPLPARALLCVASFGRAPGDGCASFAFYETPRLTSAQPLSADKDEPTLVMVRDCVIAWLRDCCCPRDSRMSRRS
eukprot:1680371-Prymnesium_polylepis.2